MQNEYNFIFSGRDSFEIRGGGRPSSTYGHQIVNIKINIDLFMSFFTNGLFQISNLVFQYYQVLRPFQLELMTYLTTYLKKNDYLSYLGTPPAASL